MSLCVLCGLQLSADTALCPQHESVHGRSWAAANRIMCNFLHRGIVPARLSAADRDADSWSYPDRRCDDDRQLVARVFG